MMASRLAIGTVEGVAGLRPRSVAGGGDASPAPVKGAMDGRDPVDVFFQDRMPARSGEWALHPSRQMWATPLTWHQHLCDTFQRR
jgi:hypothetical protein